MKLAYRVKIRHLKHIQNAFPGSSRSMVEQKNVNFEQFFAAKIHNLVQFVRIVKKYFFEFDAQKRDCFWALNDDFENSNTCNNQWYSVFCAAW